jgi:hypothetical protein
MLSAVVRPKSGQPEPVTRCLQNTPRLSVTVAYLGLESQRVCQDRSASDPVVVSLGGQPPLTRPLRPEAKSRCGLPGLRSA